jgi:hypothetical protein
MCHTRVRAWVRARQHASRVTQNPHASTTNVQPALSTRLLRHTRPASPPPISSPSEPPPRGQEHEAQRFSLEQRILELEAGRMERFVKAEDHAALAGGRARMRGAARRSGCARPYGRGGARASCGAAWEVGPRARPAGAGWHPAAISIKKSGMGCKTAAVARPDDTRLLLLVAPCT